MELNPFGCRRGAGDDDVKRKKLDHHSWPDGQQVCVRVSRAANQRATCPCACVVHWAHANKLQSREGRSLTPHLRYTLAACSPRGDMSLY